MQMRCVGKDTASRIDTDNGSWKSKEKKSRYLLIKYNVPSVNQCPACKTRYRLNKLHDETANQQMLSCASLLLSRSYPGIDKLSLATLFTVFPWQSRGVCSGLQLVTVTAIKTV
jgi:hypothetical protein